MNNNDKPYYIVDESKYNKDKRNSKILVVFFYLMVIVIGVTIYYFYRVDKHQFYLKNTDVIVGVGSSYHVSLIPKDIRYFDYKDYKFEVENSNIAMVDDSGVITGINEGTTNLKITLKHSFESKILKVNIEDVKVNSIKIDKTIKINATESTTINPIINNQDNIKTDISYRSSNSNVVDIDDFGNVVGIVEGESIIYIYQGDDEIGSISVIVEPNEFNVENISFSKSEITILNGDTVKLNPIVSPSNAKSLISYETDSDIITVNKNGEVTALREGSSTVVARDVKGKSASIKINVIKKKIDISSISLNVSEKNMNVGEKYQLITNVIPENATDNNLVWTSSDNTVATVSFGKIIALKEGNAIIKVKTSNGKTSSCSITVKRNEILPTNITLNTTDTTIYTGDTYQLNAIVSPTNATNVVSWKSSDTNIALVEDGKVVGKKAGIVKITATTSNGKTAFANILVKDKVILVSEIHLNSYSQNLKVNETFQFNATVIPSDATSKTVKWTVGDPSIATVNQTGLLKTLKAGTTTVRATADNKYVEADINVIGATPETSTKPTGTCVATLYDGSTTVNVTTNSPNILTYSYNGVDKTSNTYKVSKYLRDAYVYLTNSSGVKSKKIKCTIKMQATKVRKPGGTIYKTLESSTLKVYIKQDNGFYVSYIWAQDPVNQLKKSVIDASKGMKSGETVLKATVGSNYNNKIVLAFNASYCNSNWYKLGGGYIYEANPLVINNGKVVMNDYNKYQRNAPVYYIDGSNQLKYVGHLGSKSVSERKKIFQGVIDSGAKNTFSFLPVLVKNGVATTTYNSSDNFEYKALRQGICQVDTNNFIVISSYARKSSSSSSGYTGTGYTNNTVEFAKMFKKLGCKTAFNLDGGGSVKLYYKPKGTNTITTISDTTRSSSSMLFFTEL